MDGGLTWRHASHGGEGPSYDRRAADIDPELAGMGRRYGSAGESR
jgi:hypothetical protein